MMSKFISGSPLGRAGRERNLQASADRLHSTSTKSKCASFDGRECLREADAGTAAPTDAACHAADELERWFAYLTTQLTQRGVHKSVQALEADVRAWVQQWNTNPKPFVWTKTAEEILNSLARYLQRISDAEH